MQDGVELGIVATVLFNGTGTWFQPEGYLSKYQNVKDAELNLSETLSYLATVVHGEDPRIANAKLEEYISLCPELKTTANDITQPNDTIDQAYLETLKCQIVAGPETFATDVFYKIALGVVSILGNILNGKNIINIGGHSRGAVICIMVAWELQRIKNDMLAAVDIEGGEALLDKLCGDNQPHLSSNDYRIRAELRRMLSKLSTNPDVLNKFLHEVRSNFANRDTESHCNNEVWIQCANLLDPVPGNSVKNAPLIGWSDPKMYVYPKIMRNVQVIYCINEDSACFDSIYSLPECPSTKVTRHLMPGHHGTLAGNPLGNNCETLQSIGVPEELRTTDVQIATLYLLIESFSSHGTNFIDDNFTNKYPLDQTYKDYIVLNCQGRLQAKLQTYRDIRTNLLAYKYLNATVYIGLLYWPFHEAFRPEYHKAPNIRPIMTDDKGNRSQLRAIMPFSSTHFFTRDFLDTFMQVTFNTHLIEQPEKILEKILNTAFETQVLANKENKDTLDAVEDAIQSTIISLVTTYLKNNIDIERKTSIIGVIKQALNLDIPNDFLHYKEEGGEPKPTKLGQLKLNLVASLEGRITEQVITQVESQINTQTNIVKRLNDFATNRDVEHSEKLQVIKSALLDLKMQYYQLIEFANHIYELKINLDISAEISDENQQNRINHLQVILEEQNRSLINAASGLPAIIVNIIFENSLSLRDIEINTDYSTFFKLVNGFMQIKNGEVDTLRQELANANADAIARNNLIDNIKSKTNNKILPTKISAHVISIFIQTLGVASLALSVVLLATLALNAAIIAPTIISGAVGLGLIGFGIYRLHRDSKNAGRNEISREISQDITKSYPAALT